MYIYSATGGGGSGRRPRIASSADPGSALVEPGDFFYFVLIRPRNSLYVHEYNVPETSK